MKNLEPYQGYLNRHIEGLPKKTCTMYVITYDMGVAVEYLCEWKPFDKKQYTKKNMPDKGYLGTVKVIDGRYTGIGFHAWEQNNSEFVYYKLA